jgi:hypothetical protein
MNNNYLRILDSLEVSSVDQVWVQLYQDEDSVQRRFENITKFFLMNELYINAF